MDLTPPLTSGCFHCPNTLLQASLLLALGFTVVAVAILLVTRRNRGVRLLGLLLYMLGGAILAITGLGSFRDGIIWPFPPPGFESRLLSLSFLLLALGGIGLSGRLLFKSLRA